MNEYDYSLGVYSYQELDAGMIPTVMKCATVDRLVFPVQMAVSPTEYITIASAEDFQLSLVPQEFYSETSVGFTLKANNHLRFHITLQFNAEPFLSHVVYFQFNDQHLKSGLMSPLIIKQLLAEIIPVVNADNAIVYDERRYLGMPKRRYFKGPNRRQYSAKIGWFTYFGPRLLDFLGQDRFSKLRTYVEKYELNGGLMVVLQEEPFRNDNPEHMKRRMRAEAELNLDKLK